jgi:DNA-binding MarR family transcriptional regulator
VLDGIALMAAVRLSGLQRRVLTWLTAEERRTRATMSASYKDLVRAIGADQGNLSHSLANLAAKGLIRIARTAGGKAEAIAVTPAGRHAVVNKEKGVVVNKTKPHKLQKDLSARARASKRPQPRHYHALPDAPLQTLAEQGDPEAWSAWFMRQVVHRMATEPEYEQPYAPCMLSAVMCLHFRKEGGRVKMSLDIRQGTSETAIRTHWDEIRAWRKRLHAWQGPDPSDGPDSLYRGLHDLYENGEYPSYANLASAINRRLAQDLAAYWADHLALQQALQDRRLSMTSTVADVVGWQVETNHFLTGLGSAKTLLRDLALPDDEIEGYCAAALDNLRVGTPPFLPGEPISPQWVRDHLRHWRKRYAPWLHADETRQRPRGSPNQQDPNDHE